MAYTIRNTIVLLVLLLIVSLVFAIGNSRETNQLESLNNTYKNKSDMLQRLHRTNPDLNNEDAILAALEKVQNEASLNSKHILKNDSPTETYEYLLDICDNVCSDFCYSFSHAGSGEEEKIPYNIYIIKGMAHLNHVYSFIHELENQSALYTIESLDMKETSEAKGDSISFSLKFHCYYDSDGTPRNEIPHRRLSYRKLSYNPFMPRIHEARYDEHEEKFPNMDSATMIGLTQNQIIIRERTGRIRALVVGEKVAYGYLSDINMDKECATFRINRIGISQNKHMYLKRD